MVADSNQELFAMARKLGLSGTHVQRSGSGIVHFDLTPAKRQQAINLGAIEVSAKELFAKAQRSKE